MAAKKKAKKKATYDQAKRGKVTRKVGRPAKAKAVKVAKKTRRAPRRTADSILALLEEAKSKSSNADVIRKYKLSPTTFYSWKRKYGKVRKKRSKMA